MLKENLSTEIAKKEKFYCPAGSRCWQGGWGGFIIEYQNVPVHCHVILTSAKRGVWTLTMSDCLSNEQGMTISGQLPHLGQESERINLFCWLLMWWLFCDREVLVRQCVISGLNWMVHLLNINIHEQKSVKKKGPSLVFQLALSLKSF